MSLQPLTTIVAKIAAATAANALPALREAVNDALLQGMGKQEIEAIISLAQEIRQHNSSYTEHLAKQLLREPAKKTGKTHSHSCDCGCHPK